jgi:hypothetical protein
MFLRHQAIVLREVGIRSHGTIRENFVDEIERVVDDLGIEIGVSEENLQNVELHGLREVAGQRDVKGDSIIDGSTLILEGNLAFDKSRWRV